MHWPAPGAAGPHAEALDLLRRAVQGRPESTRFAYVFAVALTARATRAGLLPCSRRPIDSGRPTGMSLSALVTYLQERGDSKAALHYAEQLAAAPGDRRSKGL